MLRSRSAPLLTLVLCCAGAGAGAHAADRDPAGSALVDRYRQPDPTLP